MNFRRVCFNASTKTIIVYAQSDMLFVQLNFPSGELFILIFRGPTRFES